VVLFSKAPSLENHIPKAFAPSGDCQDHNYHSIFFFDFASITKVVILSINIVHVVDLHVDNDKFNDLVFHKCNNGK
jgi:hypothetical protein